MHCSSSMLRRLVNCRFGWALIPASLPPGLSTNGALLRHVVDGQLWPPASFSTSSQVDERTGHLSAEEEEPRHTPRWVQGIPIDAPRTLQDYNRLLSRLANKKRGFLMRDVLDEMSLNGVRPNRQTYYLGLASAVKSRKLGDAMYFWEEMQRHGVQPDSQAYTAIITTCGRTGHMRKAFEFREEMEGKGIPLDRGVYVALLGGFAESGQLVKAKRLFEEMKEAGVRPNELVYATLLYCYAHLKKQSVPEDVDQQLDGLLQSARESVAEGGEYPVESSRPPGLTLITYNALLQALVALGRHERVLETFKQMQEEGLHPDALTYSNVLQSYLDKATGQHLQPSGKELTSIIDGRLRGLDLTPFLNLAQQQRDAQQEALADIKAQQEGEGEGVASVVRGGRPRPLDDMAAQLARSHVRFEIMAEHVDVDSWYQALHLFQEVLDKDLPWGPDMSYKIVKASLNLAAAGVEDTLEVALTVLDKFEKKGLFVDVEAGTDMLLLAVRRDIPDLSVAHRIWDLLRKGRRFPRTPTTFKYMRAMCLREPGKSVERIKEVCTCVLSDPDRSDAYMKMKSEAYRRREAFGGGEGVGASSGSGGEPKEGVPMRGAQPRYCLVAARKLCPAGGSHERRLHSKAGRSWEATKKLGFAASLNVRRLYRKAGISWEATKKLCAAGWSRCAHVMS